MGSAPLNTKTIILAASYREALHATCREPSTKMVLVVGGRVDGGS